MLKVDSHNNVNHAWHLPTSNHSEYQYDGQCWIPIWIVATEEAQNLCQSYYGTNWHSLWTHLLQTSANSTAQQSNFPFRSIQGRIDSIYAS